MQLLRCHKQNGSACSSAAIIHYIFFCLTTAPKLFSRITHAKTSTTKLCFDAYSPPMHRQPAKIRKGGSKLKAANVKALPPRARLNPVHTIARALLLPLL
jgi:hypothetical protein